MGRTGLSGAESGPKSDGIAESDGIEQSDGIAESEESDDSDIMARFLPSENPDSGQGRPTLSCQNRAKVTELRKVTESRKVPE